MKKVFIYTSAFFIVLLFSQCGPTVQEAMDYNDSLITEQLAVMNSINNLETAFGTYDPVNIEPALENAKKQVASSIASLKELGGFYEDTKFYDETMNLYKLFESQLNNEYAEQLEIYKLSDDDYTTEKKERYNELLKMIEDGYQATFDKFLATQKEFADTWGFTLVEN